MIVVIKTFVDYSNTRSVLFLEFWSFAHWIETLL